MKSHDSRCAPAIERGGQRRTCSPKTTGQERALLSFDGLLRYTSKSIRRLAIRRRDVLDRLHEALSAGLWLTLTLGPVAVVILGHGLARNWLARALLIVLYGFVLAQPRLRQRAARARGQARGDELVCQFVIGRGAGARRVTADRWIVMPSRSRDRQLRTFELPWLKDSDVLVDVNPLGEICIGVAQQVNLQDRGDLGNLRPLDRMEESR
jgi:hypothetical protein